VTLDCLASGLGQEFVDSGFVVAAVALHG
jgi:hypothetical protein